MKVNTMNTSPNSFNFSEVQLEIPFAQPESQSIQPGTQSTIPANSPSPQMVDSALVEEVELQAQKISHQNNQKKKKERVKAAFNLMDYVVKYYNTGETYISRAFTLVGMVSLILLGANRLTTLEGGLSAFAPPLDIFPTLLTNLQSNIPTNSSEAPRVAKAIPMQPSFEQVTRLQPALVSPSFAPVNQTVTESAPAPASEPVAPSDPLVVEEAPWVSPTPAPEIPPVSLPLPEINAPLPTSVQETITEVQQGVQQAAAQLNQVMPVPEIVAPQPADLGAKITEVQQGVQQVTDQLATGQLEQIAPPSIPVEVDALPAIPAIPAVPVGSMGIFGGGD